MTSVAARVKALREALGLSQEEVGRRAGFSEDDPSKARVYVSKIETGKNQLSTAKAREQTARGFGITVAQLDAYLAGRLELDDLVSQRAGAAVAPPPATAPVPDRVVVYDEVSPVKPSRRDSPMALALGQVFDPNTHTLGDVDDVRGALHATFQMQNLEGDLLGAARTWLDAAAALRRAGKPVTAEALLTAVTLGIKTMPQDLARLEARDEAHAAESRARAAEHGFEKNEELAADLAERFARRAARGPRSDE